jgi:GNAT superfamily N-acetyltransferase
MPRPPVEIRPATLDERRFARASWFSSYRTGGFAPPVGFDVYKAGQGRLIERLEPSCTVLVASAIAVPDEVCGWVAATDRAVHYCYVKQAYRRLGIARLLLEGESRRYSHETRAGRILARKLGFKFDPYAVFEAL